MKYNEYETMLIENEKITFERIALIKLIAIGFGLLVPMPQTGFFFEGFDSKAQMFDLFFKVAFIPTCIMQIYWSKTNTYKTSYKYWVLVIEFIILALFQCLPNFFLYGFGSQEFINQAIMLYDIQSLKWLWCIFLYSLFVVFSYYVIAASVLIIIAWVAQYFFVVALVQFNETGNFIGFYANAINNIVHHNIPLINANYMLDSCFITMAMGIGFAFTSKYNRDTLGSIFSLDFKRKMLSKYFSPRIVSEIEKGNFESQRQETDVAAMFLDIRDYAVFAQNHKPGEVIDTLNEFHGLIENEVYKFNGTLEKYIGDAVFAVFGAPITKESNSEIEYKCALERYVDAPFHALFEDPISGKNDAVQTLKCAISILKRIEEWNEDRKSKGLEPLKVGIGLDFGNVICGVIGKDRNMNYAIVGNCVNRSSRLQYLCKELGAQIVMGSNFFVELKKGTQENAVYSMINMKNVEIRGFGFEQVYCIDNLENAKQAQSDNSLLNATICHNY